MSDFKIKVTADLDTSQVEAKLMTLQNKTPHGIPAIPYFRIMQLPDPCFLRVAALKKWEVSLTSHFPKNPFISVFIMFQENA